MKINNVNMNFGKSLIANCKIKDTNKKTHSVSLYEYRNVDFSDCQEIDRSFIKGDISRNFYNSFFKNNYSRFFILKDEKKDKIIAVSEATSRISSGNPVTKTYVETNQKDKTYLSELVPLMAPIANISHDINYSL